MVVMQMVVMVDVMQKAVSINDVVVASLITSTGVLFVPKSIITLLYFLTQNYLTN